MKASDSGLAWESEGLHSPEALVLTSPDFPDGGPLPQIHAAARLGGQELSPALAWSEAPPGTAEVLLVIEDPDAPTATPYIHALALIEASVTALDHGALSAETPGPGTRILRSSSGRGWIGMAPHQTRPHGQSEQIRILVRAATRRRTNLLNGDGYECDRRGHSCGITGGAQLPRRSARARSRTRRTRRHSAWIRVHQEHEPSVGEGRGRPRPPGTVP